MNLGSQKEEKVYFGFSSWSVKGRDSKKETRKKEEIGY